MISKLLITLLVLVATWTLIKRQRKAQQAKPIESKSANSTTNDKTIQWSRSDLRLGTYLFIAIMFLLGTWLYYQRWQDDHQLLTVKLFQPGTTEAVEYQVYRYQLKNRSFTTLDGVHVDIADNERMEILGLQNP